MMQTPKLSQEAWRAFGIISVLVTLTCLQGAPSLGQSISSPRHDSASHSVRYKLTDLGPLPDLGTLTEADSSEAYGIDNRGRIIGSLSVLTGYVTVPVRPFVFDHGHFNPLSLPAGASEGIATALNALSGSVAVVGDITLSGERKRACLWYHGEMTDLGTLPGYSRSEARGINNHGQIVGTVSDAAGRSAAFLWQGGRMQSLGNLPGFLSSQAMAVNDLGQVAGYSEGTRASGDAAEAFLITHGKPLPLGRIGGDDSRAFGLNEYGQVVGSTEIGKRDSNGNPITHPFLWERGHAMRDLGTLGGIYGVATAINRQGTVVGSATDRASHTHAFIWKHGRLQDLNTLIPSGTGWVLAEANAINAQGQIVGTGVFGGHEHAVLLTPQF